MCGRFVQVEKPEFYAEHFGTEFVRTETITPSWNVAPTMQVYAAAEHDGERILTSFRWGLVPFWAKDLKIGARAINARAETAADKPMFRDAFAQKRCLIPLDGFYEWERKEKGKLPHYIHSTDGSPLSAAGLWSSWKDKTTGERVLTCTILTGEPNQVLAPLHDRMPVILPEESWDEWLDRENTDVDALTKLMTVYPSDRMVEYPVSTLVNNVRNDSADLLTPLDTGAVEAP
jgi:putative SOS response-associated peptidase YedK